MKVKKNFLVVFLVFLHVSLFSQEMVITGTVHDEQGVPLPGVNVIIKGTTTGVQTDFDGEYSINAVPGDVLVFSFVGRQTAEYTVTNNNTIDVVLQPDSSALEEVVITALGISREKKALGYATQEVAGEDVNRVNTGNVTNALSGKAAGVQIRRNTMMGGSTSIVIRGNSSLTGNNQALFVIDGVPVDNTNASTSANSYDYGNAASDINPDDIKSINILKGAAATALYGSRAANGAVIITTKKGEAARGMGITLNSSVTFGTIDRSTFPQFQKEYGAAYGPVNGPNGNSYFNSQDFDGDGDLDLVVPFTQYGGFGAPYDPDLLVFQWNAVYPSSPFYMQATPWVPASDEDGPIQLFRDRTVTLSNSVALTGNTEKSNYRISYTNFSQEGIVPNSSLDRNNISLNTSFDLSDRMTASGSANYSVTDARGRTETNVGSGFSNIMVNIRDYWQPQINFRELKELYERTGENLSQFPGGTIDNPFYLLDNNRQSDTRQRLIGNVTLNYELTDWLDILGRASVDTYSYLQEERQNTLKRVPSRYTKRDNFFREANYDLMLNYNKDLGERFNLSGVFGTNIRRSIFKSTYNETNGGLIVEGLYAISNSVGIPPAAQEAETTIGVDGYYGLVSLGYNNLVFLDVTGRQDISSTLPSDNNSFFYPSISSSVIFSQLIDSELLSFGKLRLNYAEVGNSAPALSLMDVLNKPTPFGSTQLYSVGNTKNNPQLKPENTVSIEAGLELLFYDRRLGLDLSLYKSNTEDQIMPVVIPPETGYTNRFVNAGEIENKGIEVALTGIPIRTENFSWNINVNWAKNVNEVISLYQDVENLQLYNAGSNVTLNARVGEPYGVWYGYDFEYLNGQRVINQTNGTYVRSATADEVIGQMTPDWNGGIGNTFTYKTFGLYFLIDVQEGGNIYSSDYAVGSRNGLYDNTTGLNELGNPVRSPIEEGGGLLLEGVAPDGSPNTVRTSIMDRNHALGTPTAPSALHIYEASYVKLREVSLSYNLPPRLLTNTSFISAEFSIIGSNLWILDKDSPHADPEAASGLGSVQGHHQGVYPSTRDVGFNLKLQF